MKINTQVAGKKYYSIDKPKMKHVRIGGRLANIEDSIDDEPSMMYEYIEEIYGYIKDTFPKISDEEIDSLNTDKFMQLVKDIALWANGGNKNAKKKIKYLRLATMASF